MYRCDTIAAVATPPGEGGVAIVRVSGVDAESIARRVFVRPRNKDPHLKSHTLYHGRIIDHENDRVLDHVLLTVMRKPHSYTGEDVVEIHCHGGAFLVRQVLALVLREGARQAEPGEFTKRAFLNGRLDLTQAEAVLDLIRARTSESARLALDQANGALAQCIAELRDKLIDILVQIEAAIDFPEEEIELLARHDLIERIAALIRIIDDISATYDWGKLFREGARVCICGRPNVGKSSLLNALLGEERAIVTPLAGTTRDVIEESLGLDGLPVTLCDTAGIRESNDPIERIGVDRSREQLIKCDAALLVVDGSAALTLEDELLLSQDVTKKLLIVVNKCDLQHQADLSQLARFAGPRCIARISAKTGEGVPELKRRLRDVLVDSEMAAPVVITNVRHRSALQRSRGSLLRATASLAEGCAPEFVAMDLAEARTALEEITGAIQNDEILERIFSKFCIGK